MAQFKKGASGNPAGRPRKSDKTETIRATNLKHVPELLENLRLLAVAGDVQAARLFLDRCLPALKPTDVVVSLKIDFDLPLAEQSKAVLAACFSGQITPSQCQSMINAIGGHSKIIEASELLERLERIEQSLNLKPAGDK
jgi:hypothetical protein